MLAQKELPENCFFFSIVGFSLQNIVPLAITLNYSSFNLYLHEIVYLRTRTFHGWHSSQPLQTGFESVSIVVSVGYGTADGTEKSPRKHGVRTVELPVESSMEHYVLSPTPTIPSPSHVAAQPGPRVFC